MWYDRQMPSGSFAAIQESNPNLGSATALSTSVDVIQNPLKCYFGDSKIGRLANVKRLASDFNALFSSRYRALILSQAILHSGQLPLHRSDLTLECAGLLFQDPFLSLHYLPLPAVDICLNDYDNQQQQGQHVVGQKANPLRNLLNAAKPQCDSRQRGHADDTTRADQPQSDLLGLLYIAWLLTFLPLYIIVLWHGLDLYFTHKHKRTEAIRNRATYSAGRLAPNCG